MNYKCGFCGCDFTFTPTYLGGDKKHRISTQIVCPRCTNFVPTFRKVKLPDGKHYHEGR